MAIVLIAAVVALVLVLRFPAYAAVSEARTNRFNPADERALRAMEQVLRVTVYLAPTDSRRQDLENNVLTKLERVVPHMVVDEPDSGTSGLSAGRRATTTTRFSSSTEARVSRLAPPPLARSCRSSMVWRGSG